MKLTPLNIVTSLCLVTGVLLIFNPASILSVQKNNGILVGLCFLAAVVAFASDLIFRKFIPLLKKLWIVECTLIVFTIILIIILKIAIVMIAS